MLRRLVGTAAAGLSLLSKVAVLATVFLLVAAVAAARPASWRPVRDPGNPPTPAAGQGQGQKTSAAGDMGAATPAGPGVTVNGVPLAEPAGKTQGEAPEGAAAPPPVRSPPVLPDATGPSSSSAPDPGPGCRAAFAFLAAHAAPGFQFACPHYADGHQATTICDNAPECLPGTAFIWIADACPAAYMNEASNSWVLTGQSAAPWDPFGYCGEPGNPYG